MAVLLSGYSLGAQSVEIRINEFMALNESTLTDEDGDFSDWIELYNPRPEPVSLAGWTLSDEMDRPGKWALPALYIQPQKHLLIFASGKDRTDPLGKLHTNFQVSGDGEYLGLFNTGGVAVSEFNPAFPPQEADISYGYIDTGYTFFSIPTPGTENLRTGIQVPPPVFSVPHNFFEAPFQLELSAAGGGSIYFTTDGTLPGETHGTLYTEPLTVQTTAIVRAVAINENGISGPVATQSYIFPEDVIRQPNNPEGYPVEWGPWTYSEGRAPADYEMDPELMTSSSFAASAIEGLKSLTVVSLISDPGHFFNFSTDPETGGIYMYPAPGENDTGRGWERPASVEFFNRDGTVSLQVNCGMEIHGGESRRPEKNPKHSFRLSFRKEYGPSRLRYALLGSECDSSFNSLILRGGFNNTWTHQESDQRARSQYLRDTWTKDTHREMGHLASNSVYAHLFINGMYWGIYTISERLNSDFAESYLVGSAEEFDVIKDYQEVVDGSINAWDQLMDLANAGLSSDENYQRIQGNRPDGTPDPTLNSMVDVVSIADYMLLNMYGGNTDWDHHNWAAIRNRVNPGKGFIFLCWDAEHVLEALNHNVVNENNADCPSRLFQQLRQNDQFKRLFADRVQKFCYQGGPLTPESVRERWDIRKNQVEPALPLESSRWGDYRRDVHSWQSGPYELYTVENHWLAQQNFLFNTYFPARTATLIDQLRTNGLFPELDAPLFYINNEPFTGEKIFRGDRLTMSSAGGMIYYTTDGTDPALWPDQGNNDEILLVAADAGKKALVPKSDIGATWLSDPGYNDNAWQVCSGAPGGVGYEKNTGYENLISLDVGNDMHDDGVEPNTSCYIRIPFPVTADQLNRIKGLSLAVHYDDGFAAYLNGTRVAGANAPANCVWNSAATGSHEAAAAENFDISGYIDRLTEGDNLLTIQGLNTKTSSSDFIISAVLRGSEELQTGISPEALMYGEPIQLDSSSRIMARTFLDGNWSALNNRFFMIPEDLYTIKITEVHYHPLPADTIDEGDLEFIELKNTGSATLDIGGAKFIDGIDFKFPPETAFRGGEFIVLASDEKGFSSHYGFPPSGEYSGSLDNGGEWIILAGPDGDTLCTLRYNDRAPWPLEADGTGYSLVPVNRNPSGDQNNPYLWRASFEIGGSPGRDDTITTVVSGKIAAADPYQLGQNYPNPFSDLTYIRFKLPQEAFVEISVYNLVGQKVCTLTNGHLPEGSHVVSWNGTGQSGEPLAGGIYFYRMTIRNREQTAVLTRKMMINR
ncbi:MAG: lamin tail domain-containing protein [Bacteroidales bacterium]|nr:lamin tail domain-containing protein [Bacteroidales bacterium]MBN2699621.1 lamin tail domain-containing protein [Bacteroidales bacterium]